MTPTVAQVGASARSMHAMHARNPNSLRVRGWKSYGPMRALRASEATQHANPQVSALPDPFCAYPPRQADMRRGSVMTRFAALPKGHTMTTTNDTPPVLHATRDGVHLTFWCDHCRRLHHHGVCSGDPDCPANPYGRKPCTCPTGSGDGHRVAHCHDPASPYYDTGYVLREKAAP